MNRRRFFAGCGAILATGCLGDGETESSSFEICAMDVQARGSDTRTVTISLSSARTDAIEETFELSQEERRVVADYGPATSFELSVTVDGTSEQTTLDYDTDIQVFVDASDPDPPYIYASTNCE